MLAYIILAHRQLAQLERLIARLDTGAATFFVHVDRNTHIHASANGRAFRRLQKHPNVRMLPRISCGWGRWSLVEATLQGIAQAVALEPRPSHVVLLSGEDYPLVPAESIDAFFERGQGTSWVWARAMPDYSWFPDGGMFRLGKQLPPGLAPYHGSQWWALSYDCAAYIDEFVRTHPDAVAACADAHIPDEIFCQTVLMNSPLRETIVPDNLHYIDWETAPGPDHPKVLGVEDFEAMVASGKLFARKFNTAHDAAILDMLDRRLEEIAASPAIAVPSLPAPKGVPVPAKTHSLFNEGFYTAVQAGTASSAQAVVPLVVDLVQPRSVVDVGCGTGEWLAEFARYGIGDVVGVDGGWVPTDQLSIPVDRFLAHDLHDSLVLDRSFDLAVSLETAEHLPAELAGRFVASLVELAPVVLFSAAAPFQGGILHVNEQWPAYWAEHFAAHGYVTLDCIRPRVWELPEVEWWYAQNTLLFVAADLAQRREDLTAQLEKFGGSPAPLVHPGKLRDLDEWARAVLADRDAWKALAERLGGSQA